MSRNTSQAVSSLLYKFQKVGFSIRCVDFGDEKISCLGKNSTESRWLAVEEICSVDACWVHLVSKDGEKVTLFIVLDNEDCEILSDYGCQRAMIPVVDSIADEFYQQWEK